MTNPFSLQALSDLGFRPAGIYRSAGGFHIEAGWRDREVVYAWVARSADEATVLRFGIACGAMGFGRRYSGYNRWLDGKHKPDDPREQQARRVFLQRLPDGLEVWAMATIGKSEALRQETALRTLWGERLDLDLMARASWGKRMMAQWRATQSESPSALAAPQTSTRPTSPPSSRSTAVGALTTLHNRLDTGLVDLGLARNPGSRGISYKVGARLIIRIDPKTDFLRIWVGVDEEAAAPTRLRGSYKQKGWLIARPEDADKAVAYTLDCGRRRLAKRES